MTEPQPQPSRVESSCDCDCDDCRQLLVFSRWRWTRSGKAKDLSEILTIFATKIIFEINRKYFLKCENTGASDFIRVYVCAVGVCVRPAKNTFKCRSVLEWRIRGVYAT